MSDAPDPADDVPDVDLEDLDVDADVDAEVSAEPTACAYTEYREGDPVPDLPATGEDADGLAADVWDALYEVEDPEMPVSVVDLGLVYGVDVEEGEDGAAVTVEMTLTFTGCPARNLLLSQVESAVEGVDGIASADVRLIWSPEWTVEMVTDAGREDLREFGVSI